jgi:hypothetical protein
MKIELIKLIVSLLVLAISCNEAVGRARDERLD